MKIRGLFECAVYLILSFAVGASASTPIWARTILCTMIFWTFALFLLVPKKDWPYVQEQKRGYLLSIIFVAIPFFQLIPLPEYVLNWITPVHAGLIQRLMQAGLLEPSWMHSVPSICAYNTMDHFLMLLAIVCLFWMGRLIFIGPQPRKRLFMFLISLGILQAVLGLLQYFDVIPLIFPAKEAYKIVVASGTYVNRNHFAGLLEMALPILLAFAYYYYMDKIRPDLPYTRQRRKILFSHPKFPILLLIMFLGLIICLGVIFSMSRAGIFCMMATMFFLGFILSARHGRKRVQAMVFLFVLIIVCYAAWIGLAPVIDRFDLLLEPEIVETGRIAVWQDTWTMIKDFPLLGTGLGNYEFAFYAYNSLPLTVVYNHAHNDYLQYVAELGIPGAAFLFGLIFFLLVRGLVMFFKSDSLSQGMTVLGCCGAVFSIMLHSFADFNLQIPANMAVFCLLLSLLATSLARQRTQSL